MNALSALFSQIAEVVAEEAALVQDALMRLWRGNMPVPAEVEEEIEADEPVQEYEQLPDEIEATASEVVATPAAELEFVDAEVEFEVDADAAPEVDATPAVDDAAQLATDPAVDFTTAIRSLPKEADPALYSRI